MEFDVGVSFYRPKHASRWMAVIEQVADVTNLEWSIRDLVRHEQATFCELDEGLS